MKILEKINLIIETSMNQIKEEVTKFKKRINKNKK